jgi:hypothetical protein
MRPTVVTWVNLSTFEKSGAKTVIFLCYLLDNIKFDKIHQGVLLNFSKTLWNTIATLFAPLFL